VGKLKNQQRGRERTSIEESGSAHGENGLPRFVTPGKGYVSGWERSIPQRKLQGRMMLRRVEFVARKLR